MNKLAIGAIACIIIGVFLVWMYYPNISEQVSTVSIVDYKNATYLVEGHPVTLVNGIAESEAVPGSASKVVTKYFGNVAKGDINGDGIVDLVFLITQETGGSGTFFYVVGSIQNADGGYTGTSAVLLGDRIAPQTTHILNDQVLVNYADRANGEPMTAQPSVGKTLRLKLDPATMQFGEVAQDFEGEADPSRMSLDMKVWKWISATFNDGKEVKPNRPDAFTIEFSKNGRFSAKTDCNSVAGEFTAKDGKISFGQMMSTKMFCEGSQEGEFTKLLGDSTSYHFTSKGELLLDLKLDGGSVTFR